MTKSSKISIYTIGKLILGGFGFLLIIAASASSLVFGLISAFQDSNQSQSAMPLLSVAAMGGLICLLLVPMLVNVVLELLGKKPWSWMPVQSFKVASLAMLSWPLLLWLGSMLAVQTSPVWLLLPLVQVLIIFLPIWWLVELGLRQLKMRHTSRDWSVVSFSLLVSPTVIMLVEIFAAILGLVIFGIWAAGQPALLAEIEQLGLRLMNAPDDPEIIERIITPYLQRPGVILAILVSAAGVVPFLEEFFKPIAVWLLIPHKITPREGFAMGMFSGAVFALVESLGSLATPLEELWVSVVVGRMGTGLLHTMTAAIVGWGIASAWTNRRVLRLLLAYIGAVVLHAIWNTFALLMGFSPILSPAPVMSSINQFARLGEFAPYVLIILAGVMLFIFIMQGRKLGLAETPDPASQQLNEQI